MDSMSFTMDVNMNAENCGNLFFNAPEQREIDKAYAEVAALCHAALTEKCEGSRAAQERLEHELQLMKETNSAFFYRVLAEIATLSKLEKAPMFCSPAGSLIDYLIGASPLNPLKPHYWCPRCHYYEDAPTEKDAYDLLAKSCPDCGTAMERDGHDCSEWMSWASYNCSAERYSMGVRVAKSVYQKMQAHLDSRLCQTAAYKGLYQRIEVTHHLPLDTIMEYSERTCIPSSDVPPFNKEVWRELAADLYKREYPRAGKEVCCIQNRMDTKVCLPDGEELSFYDLLRLYGAFCGSFDLQMRSDELHAGRFLLKDEIYAAMLEYGIPEHRAAQFACQIAWGREELLPLDLADKCIPGGNLWRKADCFNFALTDYRVKWLSRRCSDR